MDNVYLRTKALSFNQIFATYNKVKAKARDKDLVDRSLSVLQRGYWRMTNYETFLTWSEQNQRFWAATKDGCTCPVWCINHKWCKHMVARYIVLKTLNS